MRIEQISIKGVLQFQSPMVLNVRDIPPGLVAVVGPNGEGKTTMLEAPLAALHRSFPSRSHKELVDYADDSGDSYIQTEFAIEGRGLFCARVNLDGVKRQSDAVITLNDAECNDGKKSTYDAFIEEHFPSKEELLAGAFAAQDKSGSFTTIKKSERQRLFMSFLGLSRYERMSATAKSAATAVDWTRLRILAIVNRLQLETAQSLLDDIDARMKALGVEGGNAEVDKLELEQAIDVLDARLSMVSDQAAAYQAASLRVATLKRELDLRHDEHARLVERLQANQKDYDQTLLDIDRDIVRRRASFELVATKSRGELNERIKNNRALLENAAVIREAVLRVVRIDEQLVDKRSARVERQRVQDSALETLQALDREIAELRHVQKQLDRARTDASLLDKTPFGDKCAEAGCDFVSVAATAKASIPSLETSVSRLPDIETRRVNAGRCVQDGKTDLSAIDLAVAGLERERVEAVAKSANANEIAACEARIVAYEHALDELEMKLKADVDSLGPAETELKAKAAAAKSARDKELTESVASVQASRDRLAADLETAKADLTGAEEGNQQAMQIQADLILKRNERDARVRLISRAQAETDSLKLRVADIQRKREELATLQAKVTTLDAQLLDWQLLARALHLDGLPKLEIDAAGPTVSAYTNDLLSSAGFARFTVELVTQEAKADGKGMRETFTLKVFDNERGGAERDIADLSGGQKVIVAEALMNAISVYVNQRSQMPIRTCWRDETTGALYQQVIPQYVAMLRKVQELGGFHHIFFVTHSDEAAAMADAQIVVDKGKAEVRYPPFAEAA
jgi:exonuclease SbcC